jgi:hypothetical protein
VKGGAQPSAALSVGSRAVGKRKTLDAITGRPYLSEESLAVSSSSILSSDQSLSMKPATKFRPTLSHEVQRTCELQRGGIVQGSFRVIIFAGLLSLNGCGRPDVSDQAWTGIMDTLPSGQIVVRNTDQPIWPEDGGWQVVEEVRIGSREGARPTSFGKIDAFAVDLSGRIWVLDGIAQQLRVFSPAGEHLRTVGRKGRGPAEFMQAVDVDVSQDGRVWVMDPMNARLSIFDTTGAFLEGKTAAGGFLMAHWQGGFDQYSNYYAPGYRGGLVRHDAAFTPIDTLDIPADPGPRETYQLRAPDGRVVAVANVPFSGRLVWRRSASGSVWALLTDHYRLFSLAPTGDTVRTITRSFTRLPVTSEDRDQVAQELKWFGDMGGHVDWSKVPSAKPPTVAFLIADDGYVWVELDAPPDRRGRVHDVFDPEGRFLGGITLPFAIASYPVPVIQQAKLYAVTHDDLDVPYIVVARIVM